MNERMENYRHELGRALASKNEPMLVAMLLMMEHLNVIATNLEDIAGQLVKVNASLNNIYQGLPIAGRGL